MGRFRAVSFFFGLLFALIASVSAASAGEPCVPEWVPTFGGAPGVDGSFQARIRAMVEFDDGSGPALYVGGTFVTAGGVEATGIARWDGEAWAAVGEGITVGIDFRDGVYALEIFDDGSGPALYAAGKFVEAGGVPANNIARWDGSSWSALGQGLTGDALPSVVPAIVYALEVFDDGGGPRLYAGGQFTEAGGAPVSRVARWDGKQWAGINAPLGSALSSVQALRVFDDGDANALYVGGNFRSCSGGMCINGLLRWDGAAWTTPNEDGSSVDVRTITVHDDGAGETLYIGGDFSEVSGVSARNVAKWDGASWSALGPGLSREVEALIGGSVGGERFLYALGEFPLAGTLVVNNVARWDGVNWSAMQGGLVNAGFGNGGGALAFASLGDGAQSSLFVGGVMRGAGDVDVLSIAEWDGDSWAKLGDGLDGGVFALETFNNSGGETLVVGGEFNSVGSKVLDQIARWDGDVWSAFESGLQTFGSSFVRAIHAFENDGFTTLFAGGRFTDVDASRTDLIIAWDGETWSPLGGGLEGVTPGAFVHVYAIASTDVPSLGGPALFATGDFVRADGEVVNGIARWDGISWSALNGGIDGLEFGRGGRALTVFDDGSGPALYMAGDFASVGGVPALGIARWNGEEWSAVGGGLEFFGGQGRALSLEIFDDGRGPALYVGGLFDRAGGVETTSIARWDGESWSGLDGGVFSPTNVPTVTALAAADASSGLGRALFVGGFFSSAGGVEALNIARWSGSEWSSVDAGLAGGLPRVYALQAVGGESEVGPALYVGGRFSASAGGDSFLARLAGCAIEACTGDATGDRVVDMKDLNAAVSAFGQTGEPGTIPADLDGDGTVDFHDLNEILSNFGLNCG
jgi:hypothetical protein